MRQVVRLEAGSPTAYRHRPARLVATKGRRARARPRDETRRERTEEWRLRYVAVWRGAARRLRNTYTRVESVRENDDERASERARARLVSCARDCV